MKNTRKHFNMIIAPNTEIFRADPALGQNRGRLRQHQPRATDRAAPEMDEMPVIRETVRARIFAHRRHSDAIA
jgi:hypothetical protein